jgi:gamma-glutamylaminecyclotransferase
MRLFVLGTLKRGFPLHSEGLSSATYIGAYRTSDRYPLVIAGPRYAPMMFDEPGVGLHVEGELYQVPWEAFPILDSLESIGKPGNLRIPIRVEPLIGGASCIALAYMKDRLLASPVHSGYLANYLRDDRFVRPDRQPSDRSTEVSPRAEKLDDAILHRAADDLIRRHGVREALNRALARGDDLNREGQTAAAGLWAALAEIIADIG